MDLKTAQEREEALRQEIRQLSDSQRKHFYREFNQRIKDPDTYATLNYLFVAGLHHFYLGKLAWGVFDILVFAAGLVLIFSGSIGVGVAIIVAITVVELKALFQSEAIVLDYNNRLMEELLAELQSPGINPRGEN